MASWQSPNSPSEVALVRFRCSPARVTSEKSIFNCTHKSDIFSRLRSITTTNITNHHTDHDTVNPHNQARWVTPQVFVLALAMPSLGTSGRRV